MAALFLIRGLSRNCLQAGRNGLVRSSPVGLSPELSRAFAVAPLRVALGSTSLSCSPHTSTAASSGVLSKVSSVQHSVCRSSSSGNHVTLWTAERVLSVVLLGAIPAAIISPSPAIETVLALSLCLHSHWGLAALVEDYVQPAIVGKVVKDVSMAALFFVSMMTFGSLCYFIHFDVGLVNAISMFWKL